MPNKIIPDELRDALSGLKILVVEDEFLIALELCASLEECGCAVVGPAGQLKQSLSLAAFEELDGAILDVNLHGESSFAVAAVLADKGVPYVFVSGYDDPTIWPAKYRDAPKLKKPCFPPELIRLAARQFGRPQETRRGAPS